MNIFEISQLILEQQRSNQPYLEFLRAPSMSVGIYSLPVDGVDPQQPHHEDELYYVIKGRATIQVNGQNREVEPGNLIFVSAEVEHRFHTITEDLTVLVFFAPAET